MNCIFNISTNYQSWDKGLLDLLHKWYYSIFVGFVCIHAGWIWVHQWKEKTEEKEL